VGALLRDDFRTYAYDEANVLAPALRQFDAAGQATRH
jgi:hypothetical protein